MKRVGVKKKTSPLQGSYTPLPPYLVPLLSLFLGASRDTPTRPCEESGCEEPSAGYVDRLQAGRPAEGPVAAEQHRCLSASRSLTGWAPTRRS